MSDLNTAEVMDLPVPEIGPGLLVRTTRVDEAHAELLRPMLDQVPPIIVRETGGGWSLIDGQHRLTAAKLEDRKTIRAVVVALDDAEALEAAVKANTSHGKALTLTERKAAALMLIADTDWSDRRIAAACGLHRITVGKARPDDAGGQKRPRVGQDGKTYPTVPTKCTEGFDCPAKPGADGMCAGHRGRAAANKASDGEPPSSAPPDEQPEVPAPPAAPQTPGENDADGPPSDVDAGPDSDEVTGQHAAQDLDAGAPEGDGSAAAPSGVTDRFTSLPAGVSDLLCAASLLPDVAPIDLLAVLNPFDLVEVCTAFDDIAQWLHEFDNAIKEQNA